MSAPRTRTSPSAPVELTFFCELDASALTALFATPGLVQRLRALGARVSLGILDLSPERALVVGALNRADVPVIAWQLLPREQGYWYSLCNCTEAAARYQEFHAWSEREGLRWAGIGIDIEPHLGELQLLVTRPLGFLRAAIKRGCGKRRYEQARGDYQRLVERMRSDGYRVHSYEFPFMLDEARCGSTLLQRLLGVTAVATDQRVLLVYSSFFRPWGAALLWSYAKPGEAVGVGLTGGGVEIAGYRIPPPLSWEELARDLAIAQRSGRPVHIFSLEGCLEQGFLDHIDRHDWSQTAQPPLPWAPLVAAGRGLLQTLLWLLARPWVLVPLLGTGLVYSVC
jgi:hypothetical protein